MVEKSENIDISDNKIKSKIKEYWDIAKSLLIALIIALTFRTCAYEPFHIPSGSMKPTLLVGDYLFVSKYSYGYSRYSIPFAPPLFEGRVFFTEPKRGDVVVFRLPNKPDINYIKRLIGLPGDTVQVKQGQLYVNGALVEREYIGEFVSRKGTPYEQVASRYKETLSNGTQYHVLDHREITQDNTEPYTVPEGHYFFMGDNRDDSTDSRFKTVGTIPSEYLIGRAEIIFLSKNFPWWQVTKWFSAVNFDRSLQE